MIRLQLLIFSLLVNSCIGNMYDPFEVEQLDTGDSEQDVNQAKYSNKELLKLSGEDLRNRLQDLLKIEYRPRIKDIFFIEDHLIDELRVISTESKSLTEMKKAMELLNWIGDSSDFKDDNALILGSSLDESIALYIKKENISPKFIAVEMLNRKLTKAYVRIDFGRNGYLGGSSDLLYLVKCNKLWYLMNVSQSRWIGL